MKKFLSIALALVMVLALSVTVFAADVPLTSQSQAADAGDVTITYDATENTNTPVYGAALTWTDLSVTYSYGKNWNPETLQYDTPANPSWSDATVKVTINNRSNAKIWSDVTYEAANGLAGAVEGDGEIAAASVGQATAQEVTITISGTPADLNSTAGGSITVALSDTAPAA